MKNFLSNAAFFFFELILIVVLDLLLMWALNTFIFDLFNWFNNRNTFLKILLLLAGGAALIYLILGVLKGIFVLATQPIFKKIPINIFTAATSQIMFLVNTGFLIYQLWHLVPKFSFWTTIEFLILSFIIISLNWSVLADRANPPQ